MALMTDTISGTMASWWRSSINGPRTFSAEYAYYPGTDRLFAQGVPSLSTLSYYEQDGKGNVVGVHTNGVANQTLSYDPWGNLESLSSSGSDTTQLRWKGLLWEEGPKLYYMRARWYDPVTRRFVSPDPLGLAAGINQYAFAGGDPINGSDPGGMEACDGGDDSSDEYFCDPGGGDNGPGTAATCTLQTPIAECFAPINNDPAVVLTYDWAQYIGIGGDFGTTLVLTTDDLAIYNTVGAGTGLDQGPSLMGGVATSANAVSDASTTVCGGDGAAACYSGNPSGSVYLIGAQSGAGGHGGTTYSVLMFSLQTFWHQLTNSVNQWAQGFFNNPYNNPCAVFADAC